MYWYLHWFTSIYLFTSFACREWSRDSILQRSFWFIFYNHHLKCRDQQQRTLFSNLKSKQNFIPSNHLTITSLDILKSRRFGAICRVDPSIFYTHWQLLFLAVERITSILTSIFMTVFPFKKRVLNNHFIQKFSERGVIFFF